MAPRAASTAAKTLPPGMLLLWSTIRWPGLSRLSNGSLYNAVGYREDLSKDPMLRFQDSLPRLPVPTLQETAERYLKSVHPLLSQSEFQNTQKAVEEFLQPGGRGEELQKRLVARREDPNIKNWIIEWWNDTAYLSYRD